MDLTLGDVNADRASDDWLQSKKSALELLAMFSANNSSNHSSSYEIRVSGGLLFITYSDVSTWLIVNFFTSACLIITALLILLAYDRYKRLHTGTNFILCSVLVANILQELALLMGGIVMMMRFSVMAATIPEAFCVAQSFLLLWFGYSADLLISAISVYQCLSVGECRKRGQIWRASNCPVVVVP